VQKFLVILIEHERMLARVFQRFHDAAKNLIEINAPETIVDITSKNSDISLVYFALIINLYFISIFYVYSFTQCEGQNDIVQSGY